ncbi:MAG: hypothetical protein ACLQVI_16755 [Polyangiaceae bacterium]
MKRRRLVVGSLCSVVAIGCGAGASQPEGYVLLDPAARQSGATFEVGDHVASSALPIAVPGGEHVTLHVGARDESIAVERDELVYVQAGQAGQAHVSHLKIGTDVAFDELRLAGEEGAVRGLAAQLGGTVTADGTQWRVHVPGVFAGAALAGVPEHMEGASPVFASELTETPVAPAPVRAVRISTPVGAPLAAALTPAAAGAVVGAPRPASPSPLSPVAFVAATGCPGVGGQWRGRVFSNRHGAYYDFTLSVRNGGSGLTGTVVAETWSGSPADVEPPNSCSGAQHVKVVEAASGSVDAGGNMRFDSQSWQVGSHLCGQRVTNYYPDKFSVPLADGATTAHAVVSDDKVWTDGLPFELTRVSCQ